MDFGKLENISKVNFKLPAEPKSNTQTLSFLAQQKIPQIYIGCPTWKEKCFVGKIYPSGVREKEHLYHYSRQFNTIELNSTYYGIPKMATVDNWIDKAAAGFHFCPKVAAEISHEKELLQAEACTQNFCQVMRAFREFLGITFLVLPVNFDPAKFSIVEKYVQNFPKDIPLSIEFRHGGWFYNQSLCEKTFQMLQKNNVSPVITDVAGRRDVLHLRLTNNTVVIRFVGNNLHPSDYTRIDDWAKQIGHWCKNGLQKVYFFIHQPQRELAIDLSIYLINKIEQYIELKIKKPRLIPQRIQQTFDF